MSRTLRRTVNAGPKKPALDAKLRIYVYGFFIDRGRAPSVGEMAKGLLHPLKEVQAALERLGETHAFVLQANGELWRAAPFSAVPTAFPVKIGRNSWYGNCIWDALGIPAMLHKDARIDASCACCNFEMVLNVKDGQLLPHEGIGHFAVPVVSGTRILFSPERLCCCSGRNSTSIAGANSGIAPAAEH